MPYISIAIIIYITTFIISVIRSSRKCTTDQNKQTWYGIFSGLKLGIFTSLFGCIMYFIVMIVPLLTLPFLAISVLPNSTAIGQGFYVALGGFIGYWFGRIFINVC
jgi:hypothetical protein